MPYIKRRSAGVVICRGQGPQLRYLLLRVYRNWDFPKGEIEAGETPMDAAIREVLEETTLTDLAFRWGVGYRECGPYNGKVARYYLAASPHGSVSLPVNPQLGHPEHHEFRWLSYEEARVLLPQRLLPVLDWAQSQMHGWESEASV